MIDELLSYVDHEMMLSARSADGSTLRDHLLSVQRQTGVENSLLQSTECPHEVKYLYEDYFLSMNRRRTSNAVGPDPLSQSEVQTWARLRGISLSAFEVEVLDRIETLWLQRNYERIAKQPGAA